MKVSLLKFDKKLFLLLSLAFIISTIVGTISHEYGHYTVAKYLGYSSHVSYAYTSWEDGNTKPFTDSIFSKYAKELEANRNFPGKTAFDLIQKKQTIDTFWISLAGPMQTMLTGSIGIILLLHQRRKIFVSKSLNNYQWLCIFLSLFWLRQVANLFIWIIGFLINGKFSLNGDEVELALFLKLPKGTLAISTALIGLAVLVFVIFKIIPVHKRITFIAAGFVGGILGYFIWLVWFGPILMP